MGTKPFFYICVGLTLSLPLFYVDLAVVEFFARSRTTSETDGGDIVSCTLCGTGPNRAETVTDSMRTLIVVSTRTICFDEKHEPCHLTIQSFEIFVHRGPTCVVLKEVEPHLHRVK